MNVYNDSIGVLLRGQMEKIINREDLIQTFVYDTSGTSEPDQHIRKNTRRSIGVLYGVEGGADYKLGIFSEDDEFRIVLFNNGYDPLQTAVAVWHETIKGSHTAVILREANFEHFGIAQQPMDTVGDDERGLAVIKLMMINEASK